MTELAVAIPLILILLLLMILVAYGAAAQLQVITSAGQGARLGAAYCAASEEPEVILSAARERALTLLTPLHGEQDVQVVFTDETLSVTSLYAFVPPFPGAASFLGGPLMLHYTAHYYCAADPSAAPSPSSP